MDFKLTEEQELLLNSLTELLQREAPESLIAELDEKHEFPWKPWQALADNGFLGLGIGEAYGGTPADVLTQTLVAETLGKYAFPLGVIYGLGVITIRLRRLRPSSPFSKRISDLRCSPVTAWASSSRRLRTLRPSARQYRSRILCKYLRRSSTVIGSVSAISFTPVTFSFE